MNSTTVKTKLRVFISSKIDEKFTIVRNSLATLLEETGLFLIYIFEESGASSNDARTDYMKNLDDSHACIFLIDNSVDVPDAVMEEHSRAVSLNLRRLYFFCSETENTQISLQKEIITQKGPKVFTVPKFSDLPSVAYKHLIQDLVKCYFPEKFKSGHSVEQKEDLTSLPTYLLLDKNIFKSYSISDPFIKILNPYDTHREKNDSQSNHYEKNGSSLLRTILGREEFNISTFSQLKGSILEDHSETYRDVISLRLEAIQFYFSGDLIACKKNLKEALSNIFSSKSSFPEWLKNDILIDLRFLTNAINVQNNKVVYESEPQRQLQESIEFVYYPLLDRYSDNCKRNLLNEIFVNATQSPYAFRYVSFGHYVEDLASYYNTALRFGSLAHLLSIKEKYAEVLFTFFYQEEEFILFINIFAMFLLSGKTKELEDLVQTYRYSVSQINASDIDNLFYAVTTLPIARNRDLAYCELLKHFGLYFNETQFDSAVIGLLGIAFTWLKNKDRISRDAKFIFKAIKANLERLNNQQVSTFLVECLELEIPIFYDDIFSIMQNLSFNDIDKSGQKNLIDTLLKLFPLKTVADNHNFLNTIMIFRNVINDDEIKLKFDEAVNNYMGKKYVYDYNSFIGKVDYKNQLKVMLEQAKQRNKDAVRGSYRGYFSNPFDSIRILINNNIKKLTINNINQIIEMAKNTILNENQEADNKIAAIFLIIYLKTLRPNSIPLNDFYKDVTQDNERIFQATFSETSGIATYNSMAFCLFLLDLSFVEFDSNKATILFSSILSYQEAELIAILKLLYLFLETVNLTKIDQMFLQLSVHLLSSIGSTKHRDSQFFAVRSLLLLFQNNLFTKIIAERMIFLMDNVVSEIKLAILNSIDVDKFGDTKTLEYIIQKGRIDNHYFVKRKANELTLQLANL